MTKLKNSKSHKGVRDPLKQLETRYKLIKDKINNPPKNPNEQELSKASKTLSCEKNEIKFPKKGKKRQMNEKELVDTSRFISANVGEYPKKGRLFKPVPTLSQMKNESNYKFFKRVNKATEIVKNESKFQDKHKVEVQRDESGQVTGYCKRPEYQSKKQMEAALAKKEKKILKNKEQSLKKKLKKIKRKRRNISLSSEDETTVADDSLDTVKKKMFAKDTFEFGDVVHAPPTLNTKIIEKKVKEEKDLKIKNFLFLQSLNKPSMGAATDEKEPSKLRKKILEIEREKAVFAYKQLKANKNSSFR